MFQVLIYLDANRLARELDNTRAVNLIMLGYTVSKAQQSEFSRPGLHCAADDVAAVLATRLKNKKSFLQSSIRALEAASNNA